MSIYANWLKTAADKGGRPSTEKEIFLLLLDYFGLGEYFCLSVITKPGRKIWNLCPLIQDREEPYHKLIPRFEVMFMQLAQQTQAQYRSLGLEFECYLSYEPKYREQLEIVGTEEEIWSTLLKPEIGAKICLV
jgi:hypothetical protein